MISTTPLGRFIILVNRFVATQPRDIPASWGGVVPAPLSQSMDTVAAMSRMITIEHDDEA
jgi:hypothetical protein